MWTNQLQADPTEWLLEEDNPSVRYLTLRYILDRDDASTQVKKAKAQIMKVGVVPQILSKLTKGTWNDPGRFYRDKYRGTVWQLIILAEHEASGEDRRISHACEYILSCSQDPESFGFSYDERADGRGGRHDGVIPCLTGNMVWSLVRLGYLQDVRVKKAIEWITKYQRFDDGERIKPKGWPYDRYQMCWGKHSCHMGCVKALKALSAVPERQKGGRSKETIRTGCEYLLKHHIHRRSHNLEQVSKPGWLRLQFPLMYQTDLLEVAGVLLDLGVRDERMKDAIELIVSKQNLKGQWNLEATFNGRYWTSIERKGMPSKWITYRALKVIKQYYGQ